MTAPEPPQATGGDPARRELRLAVAMCLAGAALTLVSVGRAWALGEVPASALLPARQVGVSGRELAPGLAALALVGLAAVVALAATRRAGRVVVGALVLLDGLAIATLTGRRLTGLSEAALATDAVRDSGAATVAGTAWPYAALLGGLLLVGAGSLVAVRGQQWAALGRRYEAPGRPEAPAAPTDRSLWEALDRGEDPTAH